jgi:hypothetical protein
VPKLEIMAKKTKAGRKKQIMREGMGVNALDPQTIAAISHNG